jgi:uncharacterized membrane protein YbaN (DUF454 family)
MQLFLAALGLLFLVLGVTGFALGGLPTIIFWCLAAVCFFGAWRSRSLRQRQREINGGTPPR